MCMYNALKRCGAFVAALVLCFALSVPALADDVLTGSASFSFAYAGASGSVFSISSSSSVSSGSSNLSFVVPRWGSNYKLGLGYVQGSGALLPSGASIGVYLSCYYFSAVDGFVQSKVPTSSDFSIGTRTSSVGYSFKPVSSVSLFSPSSSYTSVSDGLTIVARVDNGVGDPKTSWVLCNSPASSASVSSFPASWYVSPASGTWTTSASDNVKLMVTNFRVVSSSSNAELDALESMASNIAEQNQILSQFYGDIVAVCNQIYQRLGDLQAAQEEANALFSNVIELLKTTNGKIEAINMAMSTYFELLINQLKQEGIDTRTAIADAEARLELYLKPMIDYFNELEEQTGESASTLPQHKTDIDGFNNEGFGIDSDGQTGLAAILPIMSAFSFIFSILGIFIGLGVLGVIIKRGAS